MRAAVLAIGLGLVGCATDDASNPVCGDGVREGAEACDDGNGVSGDGCSATCAVEPFCGDGTVDPDEACDDGNGVSGDGCSATCEVEPFCGDGAVDPGEACDDGNTAPSDGCSMTCTVEAKHATTARWSVRTVAGATLGCPTGFDTVAVYSQPLAADDTPLGNPVIDLFDCAAGTGTIVPVYQGRYRTHLEVTNTNGTLTYAQSTSAIVDLTTADQVFTTAIFADGGYFAFAWNLVGGTSNAALTCAQVTGIDGISLLSTSVATPTSVLEDIFGCPDGEGVTAVLAAGSYTLSVSAINSAGESLGTAPTLTDKVIQAPNKVTDLGTITVPIDGM